MAARRSFDPDPHWETVLIAEQLDIERVHTIRCEDVNGSGEGGRYGRDEDGEAPVL